MAVSPRTLAAALVLAALPAGAAMAQTTTTPTQPYTPPTSGVANGATWNVVDLGTCSIPSGTATVSGTYVGCAPGSVASTPTATALMAPLPAWADDPASHMYEPPCTPLRGYVMPEIG